jgi:hypothetical protein
MGMGMGIVPILIPIPKYPTFLGVYPIHYPILNGYPNLFLFKINKNDHKLISFLIKKKFIFLVSLTSICDIVINVKFS